MTRQELFREEMKDLLDSYGADLYSYHEVGDPCASVWVWMPCVYDEEGNVKESGEDFKL